jgi:hypothetical protein
MPQQENSKRGVAECKLVEWLKIHSKACTEKQVEYLTTCVRAEMKEVSVDKPMAMWLCIRALVCVQISMKLLHTAEPKLSDLCRKLKESGVDIEYDVFRKLVLSNERKIVNDCGFRFMYLITDHNDDDEHLQHVLGNAFEDSFEDFVEIAYNAMPHDDQNVRVCLRRQWQIVQLVYGWYKVPPCVAYHAMLTIVVAWFNMGVWQINQ